MEGMGMGGDGGFGGIGTSNLFSLQQPLPTSFSPKICMLQTRLISSPIITTLSSPQPH